MQAGGHACTGALAGALSSSAVAVATGVELGAAGTAMGALLGAGAALLPDLDSDSATAYRSGGPITAVLGEFFQLLARTAYARTRLPHDPRSDGEHRGLVHTPVFAVLIGLLVALGALLTPWVTTVVLALVLAPGISALSKAGPRWVRDRLHTDREGEALLTAIGVTLLLVVFGAMDDLGWYAGVSIAVGMIVHSAGDSATHSGIPWTWPVRRSCRRCASRSARCSGSRWRRSHLLPETLRWRVGSAEGKRIEQIIEVLCLLVVTALLVPDVAGLLNTA